jgi:molybdopterin-biosynthesis enzyme MoeA-like protein
LEPTFDDKTFQGIAKALERTLKVNPLAIEMLKQRIIEDSKNGKNPLMPN